MRGPRSPHDHQQPTSQRFAAGGALHDPPLDIQPRQKKNKCVLARHSFGHSVIQKLGFAGVRSRFGCLWLSTTSHHPRMKLTQIGGLNIKLIIQRSLRSLWRRATGETMASNLAQGQTARGHACNPTARLQRRTHGRHASATSSP